MRAAFVHGMDLTLIVAGALVLSGAILAAVFLPRHVPPAADPKLPPVIRAGGRLP